MLCQIAWTRQRSVGLEEARPPDYRLAASEPNEKKGKPQPAITGTPHQVGRYLLPLIIMLFSAVLKTAQRRNNQLKMDLNDFFK